MSDAALLAVTTSGITQQPIRAYAATIGLALPTDFPIGTVHPTGAATVSGAYLFSDYTGGRVGRIDNMGASSWSTPATWIPVGSAPRSVAAGFS